MNSRRLAAALVVSAGLNAALATALWRTATVREASASPPSEESIEELAPYMSDQLRFAHKLGLAIQSKNRPLADFYLTELEEIFEAVEEKFPSYDGFQIAALMEAMMDPARGPLETAVDKSDWAGASLAYTNFVNACNSCHVAVQKDFIRVVAPTSNPFNQTFTAK